MKVLSLFSGIGAFEKALTNLDIQYELVNYCEIDRYASKSYAAIHNVSDALNLTDVTKVNTQSISDVDLITYGFPCQDISAAGKQKGFVDHNGNRTRSGLFFEALRIIEGTKPKYAIAENVKALTSKKFKNEFETVLTSLENAGYNNYYQVLNAKDYGVPQNRERVFIVSIRKDIDDGTFKFPEKLELKIRLKDMLEDNVDKKYFLSDEQLNRIKTTSYLSGQRRIQEKEWCDTLCARYWKDPKCVKVEDNNIIQVGNIVHTGNFSNPQCGRIYSAEGLSPTLTTCQGGGLEPKIINSNVCEQRTDEGLRFFKDNICGTLRTSNECGDKRILEKIEVIKVRKLTPKECWRLMGFSDEDFEKAKATGNSNSQLYKQAGNSIVVNVLEGIFKQLLGVKNDIR